MNLGERFKYYRQRKGLKQKDAADLIGVKNYQLGNYETNRSEPSIDVLKKMSYVYGVSIDKLVDNGRMKPNSDLLPLDEPIDVEEIRKSLTELVERINKSK